MAVNGLGWWWLESYTLLLGVNYCAGTGWQGETGVRGVIVQWLLVTLCGSTWHRGHGGSNSTAAVLSSHLLLWLWGD